MFETQFAVVGIIIFEYDACRRESRRCFSCDCRSRIVRIDIIGRTAHGHYLARSPPGVVDVSVADLIVIDIIFRMTSHKIIGYPSDVFVKILGLTRFLIALGELVHRPAEHGRRVCHRKIELNIVSRIVPSAGKIQPRILSVVKTAV